MTAFKLPAASNDDQGTFASRVYCERDKVPAEFHRAMPYFRNTAPVRRRFDSNMKLARQLLRSVFLQTNEAPVPSLLSGDLIIRMRRAFASDGTDKNKAGRYEHSSQTGV